MNFKLYILSLIMSTSLLCEDDLTANVSKTEQNMHDFCDNNASKILPIVAVLLLLKKGKSRILKTAASSVLFFPAYASYNKKNSNFLRTYIHGFDTFKKDMKKFSEENSILNLEENIEIFKKYINFEK